MMQTYGEGPIWTPLWVSGRRTVLRSPDGRWVWRELRDRTELRALAAIERYRRRHDVPWLLPLMGVCRMLGRTGTLHPFVAMGYAEARQRFGSRELRREIRETVKQIRAAGFGPRDFSRRHLRFHHDGSLVVIDYEQWSLPEEIVAPIGMCRAASRRRGLVLASLIGLVQGCGSPLVCPAPDATVASLYLTIRTGDEIVATARVHRGQTADVTLPAGGDYALVVTGYDDFGMPVYNCVKQRTVQDHETVDLVFVP